MIDNNKVWSITGSSTGFGLALAQALLERGYRVVATARKPERLKKLSDRYPEGTLFSQTLVEHFNRLNSTPTHTR